MKNEMTIAELARLLSCPEITVRSWVQQGHIIPTHDAPYRFDAAGALAVILMALARRRGLDKKAANTLYRALRERPLADVQADIAAGRTHLIVVGGEALPPCRLADVCGNTLGFRLADKLGVGFVVIDLAAAVKLLNNALSQIRENTPKGNGALPLRQNDIARQLTAQSVDGLSTRNQNEPIEVTA